MAPAKVLFVALLFLPGCFAPFTKVGEGCQDSLGTNYKQHQIWYEEGECARYGCFHNYGVLKTYRISCPKYPVPDCEYQLVSSPGSPFPDCCVRPACI